MQECLQLVLLVFQCLELQFVLLVCPVAAADGKAEVLLGVFILGWGGNVRSTTA